MPGCRVAQLPLKLGPISGLADPPAFASEMCAVAVVVNPFGAYWTMMVQLPPGLSTVPETHVPPVIENVDAAFPAVFTTLGAAVNVSEPVDAAETLTVTVPVLVVVLAGVVVNAGVGPENATVAGANSTAPMSTGFASVPGLGFP